MAFFYVSEDLSAEPGEDRDELVVLVAGGELDHHASPGLRERVANYVEAGKRRLVLDLTEVTFIDSTAIGVLVGAAARLQESTGGSVAVVCPEENERVLRIFDIAGVDSVVTLFNSCEDAISALATAG
jgi:anti-sigma B factor antagonist